MPGGTLVSKQYSHRLHEAILTNGDEHMHPNLPVLEGVLHELQVKNIRQSRSIVLEAQDDFLLLSLAEELGRRRVVVHGPVCKHRY